MKNQTQILSDLQASLKAFVAPSSFRDRTFGSTLTIALWRTTMVVTKKVEGEVDYNDGEFAEIKTIGIGGIEKDLLLGAMQIHRPNTDDSPEEFRQRFPVGMVLEIVTTTEITPIIQSPEDLGKRP
jgi:hypothetical protein